MTQAMPRCTLTSRPSAGMLSRFARTTRDRVLLNAAGEAVRAGRTFTAGRSSDDVLEGYECTFRPVPPKHYDAFLGYALWHYDGDEFPTLQLIWPDREHRHPWAAPASAWIRAAQPVLADQP
jgi:hypothetical protein